MQGGSGQCASRTFGKVQPIKERFFGAGLWMREASLEIKSVVDRPCFEHSAGHRSNEDISLRGFNEADPRTDRSYIQGHHRGHAGRRIVVNACRIQGAVERHHSIAAKKGHGICQTACRRGKAIEIKSTRYRQQAAAFQRIVDPQIQRLFWNSFSSTNACGTLESRESECGGGAHFRELSFKRLGALRGPIVSRDLLPVEREQFCIKCSMSSSRLQSSRYLKVTTRYAPALSSVRSSMLAPLLPEAGK
jgi:hypothetical protein